MPPIPLRTNLLAASFQLFLWLFFQPSAWNRTIASIDPHLSPHFHLAELNRRQLHNRLLWRILLVGYVIWPLLILCSSALLLLPTGLYRPGLLLGWTLGMALGALFGLTISLAAGIGVVMITSILLALLWGSGDIILIDLLTSTQFAIIFGITGGTILHITRNIAQPVSSQRPNSSPLRQTGGLVIGLLGSALIAAVAFGTVAVMVNFRHSGTASDWSIRSVMGIIPGVVIGLVLAWRTGDWRRGLLIGSALFVSIAIIFGDAGSTYGKDIGGLELVRAYVIPLALIYTMLFLLSYVLVEPIAGPWAGAVAGCVGGWAIAPLLQLVTHFFLLWPNLIVSLLIFLLSLSFFWWRPLLFYPLQMAWNWLLYQLDQRLDSYQNSANPNLLLRWHAAFWDELQRFPLYGLEQHLVWLLDHEPTTGRQVLEEVESGHQRWAAQAAQIELDARRLEQCKTVMQIAEAHMHLAAGDLEGPVSALLRSFSTISQDVAASCQQGSIYNQRLLLRDVETKLDTLLQELSSGNEQYANRFRPIAEDWWQSIADYADELSKQATTSHEIPNPYIVGVPLSRFQEIFVGRAEVCAKIEEILLRQDAPPILLYGQRRMGKTSLLNNLRRLLPRHILPLVVDLQGPVSLARDHAGLLYNMAKAMVASARLAGTDLPELARADLSIDPFTVFDNWLDRFGDAQYLQERTTILLALDEFEALDHAFSEERFEVDAVLGLLRHITQRASAQSKAPHVLKFQLILAGSHTLNEFQHWTAYLNNAQAIRLSYLQPNEARQLIEQPIIGFNLTYAPEAIQRIITVTQRHPYLTQLICSEMITMKNRQPIEKRTLASIDDVEAVLEIIFEHSTQFFADMEQNQVSAAERRLLHFLAQKGEGAECDLSILRAGLGDSVELSVVLESLLAKELLEKREGGYCFQIELIRRWFL